MIVTKRHCCHIFFGPSLQGLVVYRAHMYRVCRPMPLRRALELILSLLIVNAPPFNILVEPTPQLPVILRCPLKLKCLRHILVRRCMVLSKIHLSSQSVSIYILKRLRFQFLQNSREQLLVLRHLLMTSMMFVAHQLVRDWVVWCEYQLVPVLPPDTAKVIASGHALLNAAIGIVSRL